MAISKVTSGGIADGTLSVEDIADDAVTAAKLANSINTDIATGVTGNTTANAALPKAGGAMTGTITGFTSTGIDDNADATAITIDSSENVGIGTSSPSATLNVKRTANGTIPLLKIVADGWDGGAAWATGNVEFFGNHNGTSNDILFIEKNSAAKFVIDSTGAVTMPNQPAMTLSGNNQTYAPRTAAGIVKYNIALSGNITGWSNSLYRYTAPVAGMYQVSGWALITPAATFEMRLRKNGVTSARYYETSSRTTSFTTLIYLNVNDYIEIWSDKDIYLHTTSPYSGLSISLHS